jgi:hypothetical protein
MGTRVIYQVRNSEKQLVATLFSNSSHASEFAEDVFDAALKDVTCASGANALVERLIGSRYTSDSGNHRQGERIFWLVPADEAVDGDREFIVTVTPARRIEELAERSSALDPAWQKTRKVARAKEAMQTFSMRAECEQDVKNFAGAAAKTYEIGRLYLESSAPLPDVDVEFRSNATLDELHAVLETVPDSHVMRDTLKMVPLAKNDLRR